MNLKYNEVLTFVEVASSSGYGNSKTISSQHDVDCIFIQNTQFNRGNYQENVDADAFCYPDPENSFIQSLANRLEGLYILAPLFGASDDQAWYKVTDVTVNRDHLLTNTIDNIELKLKKTRPIPGVS